MRKQPYHDRNDTSTDSTKSSGCDDGETRNWRHKVVFLKEMIVGVDLLVVVIAASIVTIGVNRLKMSGNPLSQILSRPSAHWVHSTPLL